MAIEASILAPTSHLAAPPLISRPPSAVKAIMRDQHRDRADLPAAAPTGVPDQGRGVLIDSEAFIPGTVTLEHP